MQLIIQSCKSNNHFCCESTVLSSLFLSPLPPPSSLCSEFLLVCQRKKDMRIWMEQLQAQNTELMREKSKPHKTAPYITRMRLQHNLANSTNPSDDEPLKKWPSISQLDSNWLNGSYTGCPGEIALEFFVRCSNPNTTKPN